jgi:hypothetical protein
MLARIVTRPIACSILEHGPPSYQT